MSDETKKDFLGQEYGVGDTIVYAGTRDRSVQMVLAKVVKFNESGSVQVQPVQKDSRWKQHHGSSKWIDSRTGKKIDPYADEHVLEPSKRRHRVTGALLSSEEFHRLAYHPHRDVRMIHAEQSDWEYVPYVFKDHVVKIEIPVRPVTLQVTENIIKVDPSFAEEDPGDR